MPSGSPLRVLVAIANHGERNRHHLDVLLREYRSMEHKVDVVVLSDTPKDLGDDVEVRVGAPTDDPWSLPFAHRQLFAERAGDYDLYVYSEDDTPLTQRNLDAFVEVDRLLPETEVPGFMRYEEHPTGERSYCSVHSGYRWLPDSVRNRGGEVFASFTNAHSACYVLTRDQLARAIRSGGFLVAPHAGEYDMLVSAATDPYTRCGLSRRVCVSRLEDFLLHHLPDVYLGKLGVTPAEHDAQIAAVHAIAEGSGRTDTLVEPGTALPTSVWDLPTHPKSFPELAEAVPAGTGTALSVGCTAGRLERDVFGDACRIVAVPVDDILAAVARTHGIETLAPDMDEAFAALDGARFPVVLVHRLLAHVPDPVALLRRVAGVVAPGGTVVATAPNIPHERLRRRLGKSVPPIPEAGYAAEGVHPTDGRQLMQWLSGAGLEPGSVRYRAVGRGARVQALLGGAGQRWTGKEVVATASLPR